MLNFMDYELVKLAEVNKLLLGAGSLAGAVAASLAGHILAESRYKDALRRSKGLPKTTENKIQQLKEIANVPHIKHKVLKNYNNGLYVGPQKLSKPMIENLKMDISDARKRGDIRALEGYEAVLKFNDSPQGGLIVGDKLKNEYIVAHELGHAMIENEDSLKAFLSRNQSALGDLLDIGAAAALIGGSIKPGYIPALAGGLAALEAANAGITYNIESTATEKAKTLIENTGGKLTPGAHRALNSTLSTYGAPEVFKSVIARPLAIAGMSYLASNLMNTK